MSDYPFAVNLNKCMGIRDTLNDLSNNIYVPNKTEKLNLSAFNMITGRTESKISTKYISSKYKCNLKVEVKWSEIKLLLKVALAKISMFDFHNIRLDEKSYKNIWIYKILSKNSICANCALLWQTRWGY